MKVRTVALTALLLLVATVRSAASTTRYDLDPKATAQTFEGWGVSLCWWANMCGRWSDERIDSLLTWLVSPEGLNYRLFRYNIGGGEDPQNRHCTPHHMGKGKGLRAEMEGFKDSTDDAYHWDRDAAQRKIMLRIRQLRPDAEFEAFSNSCPWYMTESGCVGGGESVWADNLRADCFEAFAHYLVDVCKHYHDRYGITFRTLEPFNESTAGYWGVNGTQEGCHFSETTQARFLRVLAPILQASGLATKISASDETSVEHSIRAFNHYAEAGVLPLVGQWNVHTYEATDAQRQELARLTRQAGIRLWMSETGSGGSGIAGNLKLARRLIADVRLLQPAAWFDWQYVEENNDQWCMVRGDFAKATFHRVKNYYVRQHFSRFIDQGYTFLTTPSEETLAAMSPDGKTVVVVMINDSTSATTHDIGLSKLGKIRRQNVKGWRTTQDQDMAPAADFAIQKRRMSVTLPPGSITTLVVSR